MNINSDLWSYLIDFINFKDLHYLKQTSIFFDRLKIYHKIINFRLFHNMIKCEIENGNSEDQIEEKLEQITNRFNKQTIKKIFFDRLYHEGMGYILGIDRIFIKILNSLNFQIITTFHSNYYDTTLLNAIMKMTQLQEIKISHARQPIDINGFLELLQMSELRSLSLFKILFNEHVLISAIQS